MLQATLSFKDKLWSVIKTIVSKLLTAIVWIFVSKYPLMMIQPFVFPFSCYGALSAFVSVLS